MNVIRQRIPLFLFILLFCCGCTEQTIENLVAATSPNDSFISEEEIPVSTEGPVSSEIPDSFDVVNAENTQEYVTQMGMGWNLGNSLDPANCTWLTNDMEYETAWGNPPVTKELISYIKAQGFTTIRIPVTWKNHMDENHRINDAWMNRVAEVVDWCMEEDFFVIINIHHEDDWLPAASTDYDNVMAKYRAIWTQIADRFGSYNEKLIFESMNEIGFPDLSTEDGCRLISRINGEFTDLIRSSGQNNDNRYLLLAGYWTDIDSTCLEAFSLPSDDRIILSVHYYSPSDFAIADSSSGWGYRNTWGTAEDLSYLEAQFQKLENRFINQGIPVIVGEYGVIIKDKDETSRILWFDKVCEVALKHNCCPIIWDNGEIVDRNNLSWKTPALQNVLFENTK